MWKAKKKVSLIVKIGREETQALYEVLKVSFGLWGGRRGLLETEKPPKKSSKTAVNSVQKPKTEIKALTDKAFVGFGISLSVI